MVATEERSIRHLHLFAVIALVGAVAAGTVYAQSRTTKAPPLVDPACLHSAEIGVSLD